MADGEEVVERGDRQLQDENDVITVFSDFVDRHIRLIKGISWLMAGTGMIVLLRKTYAFRTFKTVSDIPGEFLRKGISLRGKVEKVANNSSLHVLHIPPLRKVWSNSNQGESSFLLVNLAGVQPREGSHQWLSEHVLSNIIHFIPLKINSESNKLECVAYKKKGWLPSMCINEEVVRQGVAVTCHNPALAGQKQYEKLVQRLLVAEVKAEKRGHGIWVKPTWRERLKSSVVFSPLNWLRTKISGLKQKS